ncbi:trypsin-like peptidase domain-containing protein [Streptomyces sp. CA-111067]|uniref:VMAP-C domain-containing protein n=1 Tax=Streptomyces sp. CA-111067 TaxID=3240046 RepID=UPI003D99C43F
MSGGAQEPPPDPAEILVPLVSAATVRVHGAESGNPFLGSGFFVAPNWVLTCAHVAPAEREASVGGAARTVLVGYGDQLLSGVVEWSDPAADPGIDRWPAPDLALIRLLDIIDHPCVWLTERTAKGYSTNQVAYFGWVPMDGEVMSYNGRCTISGQLGSAGGGILKLGNEDEMPYGVSGGPVVDLVRGEVIGVLKSRRTAQDGGLAVGIQQLRKLPAAQDPAKDLYHRVMTSHDLYHADRYRSVNDRGGTWTDAHSELGAAVGRALTPGQRTTLLGRLAGLPPPASAKSLQDIIGAVRGSPAQGLPVAPRGWRDGLGLLYDLRRGSAELEAVLRYAVHAATADRTRPADETDEKALWVWAQDAAADAVGLTRLFRNNLVDERRVRLRARGARVPEAVPAHRARQEALVEIIPRGWEPGRYDWRVCVVPESGEVDCVQEEFGGTALAGLPAALGPALAEAFRRCDAPGYVAALQLAVPGALVAFAADTWPLGTGGAQLGTERPVVVRRTDPTGEQDRDPAWAEERLGRWLALHQQPPRPEILDCDDGTETALPGEDELRARPRDTLPVLCRSAGAAPEALHRIAGSGYCVALWRREPVESEAVCADFHRGVHRTVRDARSAGRLPAALTALRAAVADGVPEAYWSIGLTLLYDDPTRPLPGSDELLETP